MSKKGSNPPPPKDAKRPAPPLGPPPLEKVGCSKISKLPRADISEAAAAVVALKRDLPHTLAMLPMLAAIRKVGYDAYLKQGFTEDQALELCKTMRL